MSALGDVAAAIEPSLRPYAVATGEGRFDGDRAFALEAVYEGFLLHYGGEPRAFAGMDPDLRLLAGDTLYALGLEQLARDGDLEAVAELADLISLCARAQAESRPELIELLWAATVRRLDEHGSGARAEVAQLHGFSA